MYKKFNALPRLAQILLLLIPGVNWITELVVRWSIAIEKEGVIEILLAVFVTVFGLIFGWLDLIWCLLFKHLILAA